MDLKLLCSISAIPDNSMKVGSVNLHRVNLALSSTNSIECSERIAIDDGFVLLDRLTEVHTEKADGRTSLMHRSMHGTMFLEALCTSTLVSIVPNKLRCAIDV